MSSGASSKHLEDTPQEGAEEEEEEVAEEVAEEEHQEPLQTSPNSQRNHPRMSK